MLLKFLRLFTKHLNIKVVNQMSIKIYKFEKPKAQSNLKQSYIMLF
jgi:hypothetical protein